MNYCENCGKELKPGEVCDCQKQNAQENQNQAAEAQNAAQQAADASQTPAPQKDAKDTKDTKDNKKLIMIAAGAGAALLVVILIAALAIGGGGYKAPVRKLTKLINSQNTDVFAYQGLISSPMSVKYTKQACNIMKKSADFKEELQDVKEEMQDFYDDIKGFKITEVDFINAQEMKSKEIRAIEKQYDSDYYEDAIDRIKDMDKADYEDMAEDLEISVSDAKRLAKATVAYCQSMDKVKVTKGYEVTLRIYGKYEGDKDKTEKIEDVRIIKMNGTWYIYDSSKFFRSFYFTDDLSDVSMTGLYRIIGNMNILPELY